MESWSKIELSLLLSIWRPLSSSERCFSESDELLFCLLAFDDLIDEPMRIREFSLSKNEIGLLLLNFYSSSTCSILER